MSGGPIRFREDDEPRDERPMVGAPADARRSWLPVIVGAATCLIVVGGLVWLILPKDDHAGRSEVSQALSDPVPSFTNRQAGAQPSPTKSPYDGAPKLTVQLLDTNRGTCPATFTESIVVPVIKGDVESITAVVRIPYDKVVRQRELYAVDSEWSTIIGGLPTNRTIHLLLIAQGSGGKSTTAEEISHLCGNKPVDRPDPRDLGTKLARQRIRQHMFNFSFDFNAPKGHQGQRNR